jgi:hypothetical protein
MYMSLGKPQDTTLATRQLSSRPNSRFYTEYISRGKPQEKTLGNDAERRDAYHRDADKIQYTACVSPGKPQDKALAKQR